MVQTAATAGIAGHCFGSLLSLGTGGSDGSVHAGASVELVLLGVAGRSGAAAP
jgi:hypothetical protein